MRYGVQASHPLEWLALQTKKVPLPVLDVIVGPLQARALIAAERVGLLAALAEAEASCELLAARLGVDTECLELVLRVLRAMRYVALRGGRWRLSRLGARYFGKDAPQPCHGFLDYGGPQWRLIERLEEVLRRGQGVDFHAANTPEEWAAYQRAMLENASAFASFVADQLPVPRGATRCLDLAGAHGLVGATLCRRHPGLRSTVLDLPDAIAAARPLAEQWGHADVVSFRAGDLVCDDYGVDYDVVLLCNVLHHFAPATHRAIVGKVQAALRPGGVVGIFDIEPPEPGAAPEAGADAFALYFRITSNSRCFRGRDCERWLADGGFRAPRTVRSIQLPSRMLVIAER